MNLNFLFIIKNIFYGLNDKIFNFNNSFERLKFY